MRRSETVGFKKAFGRGDSVGFPLRPTSLYLTALQCGLISKTYGTDDGFKYDITGQTRPAIQAETLVGDTVMYLKFASLPNQAFSYVDATTKNIVNDSLDGNGEWIVPTNGAYSVDFVISGDTYHLFIEGIDDANDVIQLIDIENNVVIDGQLLPASLPTTTNNDVVSLADDYGYTIADGTQYRDAGLTDQISPGTIILTGSDNRALAYITGGVRPYAAYYGPVAVNFVVTDAGGTPTPGGSYIKLADLYNIVFTKDTTEILTDKALNTNKVYEITVDQVINHQFLINVAEDTISYYSEALTGECLVNAGKFQNMNEPYFVQTAEGSGQYEPYFVTEGLMYVWKEGTEVI